MEHVKRRELDDIINKCLNHLKDSQRKKEDYFGWHQHLGTNKLGIVATSMALLSYDMMDNITNCPNHLNCLEYINTQKNKDNGWSYISNSGGTSNVEATCWAIQALLTDKNQTYKEEISKAVHWVLSQHSTNKITDSDAGWAYIKDAEQKVYVTCLAIKTLSLAKKIVVENIQDQIDTKITSAISWLKSIRKDCSGWGENEKSDANLFYTSYVVPVLIEYGNVKKDEEIIINAIAFIQSQLASYNYSSSKYDCLIEFIEYNDPNGNNRIRVTFFHDVLQYALIALINSGKEYDTVYWGIKYLCSKFCNGEIEHPLMEKSKIYPIWPIYDTLLVFHSYVSSLKKTNWNNVKIIYPCSITRKTHISTKYWPHSYLLMIPDFYYYLAASIIIFYILIKFNVLNTLFTLSLDFLNKSDNTNFSSVLCNIVASVLIMLISFAIKQSLKRIAKG